MKKSIVVSGINLFEGGTLAVYQDMCESFVSEKIYEIYDITIFVHKESLFTKYHQYFQIIEIPNSRKNWLNRLYYEYLYFWKYSKDKDIFLWISIHDMTPHVKSQHIITYCHNATPFYKSSYKDWKLDKKVYLFSNFYKYLYRINIKSNDFIIVQQNWLSRAFKKEYPVKDAKVFYPNFCFDVNFVQNNNEEVRDFTFIYPTYPRVFKNIELICEAVKILNSKKVEKFQVLITVSEWQNAYSKEMLNKYECIRNIKFIGPQNKDDLFNFYNESNCLLFPSKLETFGLPIMEFKAFGKPMLLADLLYAHESANDYPYVAYFNSEQATSLAEKMYEIIQNTLNYDSNNQKYNTDFISWKEVVEFCERGGNYE